MISKIIGGVLLIIGTAIGAGMLALPVVTAAGGFIHSLWLFFLIWAITTVSAFFILEVNLWLPEGANLISMARVTLGRGGEVITWIVYLLLLYTLLAAYTAGGADLLQNFFAIVHTQLPRWFNACIFVLIFMGLVYPGLGVVDWSNRGFMAIKILTYLAMISFMLPYVHLTVLAKGQIHFLLSAIMVVVTAFGYAVIIPSLRTYFNSNVRALRITLWVGSLAILGCYLLWDFVVQGTLHYQGQEGLMAMAASGRVASQLTTAISMQIKNTTVDRLAHIFTAICIATSCLGVSLALSDFLKDGLPILKPPRRRGLLMLATFMPSLLVVIIYPDIFIYGLYYAGIFCVTIFVLLPSLMVISGRYYKKIACGYCVGGGRGVAVITLLAAILLLLIAFSGNL